jgi:hypothetical protein
VRKVERNDGSVVSKFEYLASTGVEHFHDIYKVDGLDIIA